MVAGRNLVAVIGITELLLDVRELGSDALLLGLEQVDRYSSGVVGVEKLLPVGGQGGALGLKVIDRERVRTLIILNLVPSQGVDHVSGMRGSLMVWVC